MCRQILERYRAPCSVTVYRSQVPTSKPYLPRQEVGVAGKNVDLPV